MLKLRTGLLLGIVVLVAAIIASVIFAVSVVVERGQRASLDERLQRAQNTLLEVLQYRATQVASDCHLLANESVLRAVVNTDDVSTETVDDTLAEIGKPVALDLLLVTDEHGTLLGTGMRDAGHELAAILAATRAAGDGAAIWIVGERPHQMHACPIVFGEQLAGYVIVGRVLAHKLVEAIHRQTGAAAVIALDGKAIATSELPGDFVPQEAPELEIAGTRYVSLAGAIDGYAGTRALRYMLLHSLDEALAPATQLTRTVLAIAGSSLVLAIVIAYLVARRLSRPVDRLVELSHAVGGGDLTARARPGGAKELRTLAKAMNLMVQELETNRRTLADKQRLEREMEIAQKIQTSILPRNFTVANLEIAAQMIPADEVGGDYYDIIPTPHGCWIGIGDVAGHGLTAGLEMLMVQSVVAGLVRKEPTGSPSQHVAVLNRVMYENIHERLRQDEYVTFTLFRFEPGRIVFAGAHEEILVLRAATGECERWETPGTWIGGMPDVASVTQDGVIAVAPGDLVVLYTDGITEARNAQKEQYGIDRMVALLVREQYAPVDKIRDRLLDEVQHWQARREDDLSVLVLRVVA